MIWLVFGLVAALALAFALYPLAVRQKVVEGHEDMAVYRRQLAEIETERGRGLLSDDAAAAATLEVERRLLKAGQPAAEKSSRPLPRRWILLIVGSVFSAVLILYLRQGSPAQPDAPSTVAAQQMIDTGNSKISVGQALDRLLAYLADNPEDLEGWGHVRRLAPLAHREGDYAQGLMRAVAAKPQNGVLRALYVESLLAMGGGRVSPAVMLAINEAESVEPTNPGLRYYKGLALAQSGDVEKAAEVWQALLADSAPDAPWRPQVEGRLRELGAEANRSAAMNEIAALSPEERQARIRAMVEGLAARLEPVPDQREGWARLARAYKVLGEKEKAAEAYATARKLAAEAGDQTLLDALAQDEAAPLPSQ